MALMDGRLEDFRRRVANDPEDRATVEALARALSQLGRRVEAYELLVDHGALEGRDPLVLELGRKVVEEQEPHLQQLLNAMNPPRIRSGGGLLPEDYDLHFAVDKSASWNWVNAKRLREIDLPLRALRFTGWVGAPTPGQVVVLKNWPLLHHLELSGLGLVDEDLDVLTPLTDLRSLGLGGNEGLTNAGLERLSGLTRLRELDLIGSWQIPRASLAPFASLRSLRKLVLPYCRGMAGSELAHLGSLSELRSLELQSCGAFEDDSLEHLLSLDQLEHLDLGDAP